MDTIYAILELGLPSFAALAVYILSWLGLGWRIEHPGAKHPSVSVLMSQRRREWMKVFVTRDPRIFDSQVLGQLRQGTAFFASTSLLAIGAVMAAIGNSATLQNVADQLGATEPLVIWQAKLAIVGFFLANAFLRFVWANRVFGYCAVVMGAVPNDPEDASAFPKAAQAAELNIRAAINFNRGLRSIYFALGAVAFLLSWQALLMALGFVGWVVWSREFASKTRTIILD